MQTKCQRGDNKYDYVLSINHNQKKVPKKGSAIFIHLTDNYKPTAGCIALKKKDFQILLKLVDQKTKIKIGQPLLPNIFEPILIYDALFLTASR